MSCRSVDPIRVGLLRHHRQVFLVAAQLLAGGLEHASQVAALAGEELLLL
jgi:hypothetical protein